MSLLNQVNSPERLKEMEIADLEQLCSEIRQYMIECCSENPGHLGSSLGAVEIAVALHKVFDTPEDKIIWDVGHQAYAHKIITGRREAFRRQRCKGGISGFPKRAESQYDAFGSGHSSTSVSAALGMAIAAEKQGIERHHIAVIGDGAMTGGLAFEGLNNAGSLKTDLLVILNDNQISIDENTGALHNHLTRVRTSRRYNNLKKEVWDRLGDGHSRQQVQRFVKWLKKMVVSQSDTQNMFSSLGFRYFGPFDGNNIYQLVPLLERMKEIGGPKILHLVTMKGKGYKPAEANPTVWHAPGFFDPETGIIEHKSGSIDKYQTVFGETVLELARRNSAIVGITPAMLSGGSLNIMQAEMPDRVFDVGIAEGHAVTFSAGLAAGGMLPVCNIYSSFMQRAYDNLIHDVALQNLKVIFTLDRGGIVGEDGATHQGLFDLAAFRPVPNLAIAAPMNELELRNMLYSATLPSYPATIIRYPRGKGIGKVWREQPFEEMPYGKAELLNDGSKIAVLTIGPVGNAAASAIEKVESESNHKILHYNMRFLKPIDKEALEYTCSKADTIITVEDAMAVGGLHGAVSEYIADNGLDKKVIALGVQDKFVEHGSVAELQAECGYDEEAIYNCIKSSL
ncbi:MAG: 1-deoxy-D-xylulose-5-phosphate synthase [Bacteroidales bacterium]|nr:1-deoxy-D-xylulose-5-phosphate synthase [Bacteroidales bacterium]